MKMDIRQVLDVMNNCGYKQVKLSDQTSQRNWYEYEQYEFENEFTAMVLTFIQDPMSAYSFRKSKRKQKPRTPTMDEVQFRIRDKQSGKVEEYDIDMRRTGQDSLMRFIWSFSLGIKE